MQWNDTVNAGFTLGKPWLPVPDSYHTHNVASELQDPNSILNFYKRLLALRHNNQALLEGEYVALDQDDPNVLAYLRRYKNQAVLVVLNMSPTGQTLRLNFKEQGLSTGKFSTLLSTLKTTPTESKLDQISLNPFSVYIAQILK
jgi:glycosidase